MMTRVQLLLPVLALLSVSTLKDAESFSICCWNHQFRPSTTAGAMSATSTITLSSSPSSSRLMLSSLPSPDNDDGSWKGEVVPQGTIRGCSITPVGESEPYTEWTISIDGIEADLGKFSEAIYKQVTNDAKKQRFQGFRPGTIPPHLEQTYRAFTMDECARETVLEAMQQNDIRPFTDARSNFRIEKVSIPFSPTSRGSKNAKKNNKKGKKSGKKENPGADGNDEGGNGGILLKENVNENPDKDPSVTVSDVVQQNQWQYFETMDGAIKAGWKPGQSFSFVATNVKGQRLLKQKDVDGARPLGFR